MSKRTYYPERGDIIHVNFSPSAGREFTGPHFGLVISSLSFSHSTGLCIVLPATTKHHADIRLHDAPLMVALPAIAEMSMPGWLYAHHTKTIDYRERGASFIAKVDDDFLIDMMERVRSLIDPDSAV